MTNEPSTTELRGRYLVIGPPGTGKTTFLSGRVKQITEDSYGKVPPGTSPVVISSLTRAAAAVIAGKVERLPKGAVATLHAHGFRSQEMPTVLSASMVDEWNRVQPGWALTRDKFGSSRGDTDPGPDAEGLKGDKPGDIIAEAYHLLRHRMTPRDEWPQDVALFAELFEDFKRDNDAIDYTDMIALASDMPPLSPEVLILDEVQDFSALEWSLVAKWEKHCRAMIAVGDPYQCQPSGTPVLTTNGYVLIENLDPAVHLVVSFDRRSSLISGRKYGLKFSKQCNSYRGNMVRIETSTGSTRCTPNHKWTVRIEKPKGMYCVYIMRRANRWRVGTCKLARIRGALGIKFRLYQERGDAAWILAVFNSNAEALAEETIVSCKWSIPQTCFELENHCQMTEESRDRIFNSVSPKFTECLTHYGREISHPFCTPTLSNNKWGVRTPTVVHACNLFPEFMSIPVAGVKKEFSWQKFSLGSETHDGLVWSLKVDRHEHYIVEGGIVTHNSLYSWRGAHPQYLTDKSIPANHRGVLRQSYRVPLRVQQAANKWVSQLSDYEPVHWAAKPGDPGDVCRTGDGDSLARCVRVIDMAAELAAQGKTVMIQGTCNYMLDPVVDELRSRGLPFGNPYRRHAGRWNPLARRRNALMAPDRLLAFLSPVLDYGPVAAREWAWCDLAAWVDPLTVDGTLVRGAKSHISDMAEQRPDATPTAVEVADLFEPGGYSQLTRWLDARAMDPQRVPLDDGVRWWEQRLSPSKAKSSAYTAEVVMRHGVKAIIDEPRIMVGTMHSFKGGECDVAFVAPDISNAAGLAWCGHLDESKIINETIDEKRDSVIRTMYVGMTRCREALVLLGPSPRSYSVNWMEQ